MIEVLRFGAARRSCLFYCAATCEIWAGNTVNMMMRHRRLPAIAVLVAVIAIGAIYVHSWGRNANGGEASLADLKPREWALLVPLVALTVLMGVLPNLFLKPMAPSVERLINQATRGASFEIRARR